jgi:deoxycytidylate deaminase
VGSIVAAFLCGVMMSNKVESKEQSKEPSSLNLKSAVEHIYNQGQDLVLLGLTGRTGSGCSTAAKILQSEKSEIKHGLFDGHEPQSNEHRKERIIQRYFDEKWQPFHLIQVRSIITLFLLSDPQKSAKAISENCKNFGEENKNKLLKILCELKDLEEKNLQEDPIGFYTKKLPERCEAIKKLLDESAFVQLYQMLGTNLRKTGKPFDENPVGGEKGHFFTLAERVKKAVGEIYQKEKSKDDSSFVFIVIDAIRNPLEAIFFQERYSSFFLVAVSAPEEDRVRRLKELKHTDDSIKKIDNNENTANDLNEQRFFSVQDIPACLQRADIYISNPDGAHKFQGLANQLIRFVSLIRRPGIVTPTAMERCMQIAYTAKLNSGCISRQVGAVVTDKNFSIRAVGWNDTPHGQVPCNLRNRDDLVNGRDAVAYSVFEKTNEAYLGFFREKNERLTGIPEGLNKAFCFKSDYNEHRDKDNQVHTRSLHAEENAFLQVSKYGLASVEGGTLFTTASPCELCAKKAYQLGIKEIFYVDPYPGIAYSHILQGGSNNPSLKLFSGAIGRAFHQLYSPVVPYKDELKAYTDPT